MIYKRKNAMRFMTIGRLTVTWVWRRNRRRRIAEGMALRLPSDHVELALGLTAIVLAALIGALPMVVWLMQEYPL